MAECAHGNTACYHCGQCGYCLAMLRSELDRLTAALAASEERERVVREEIARELESDAASYDGSADETATDKMCHAYEVGRAMAAACRSAARRVRALSASPAPSAECRECGGRGRYDAPSHGSSRQCDTCLGSGKAPPTPPPQTEAKPFNPHAENLRTMVGTGVLHPSVATWAANEIYRLQTENVSLRAAPPPEELTAEREPSCRERRLAKLCGDKKLVLAIRPKGYGGWLYLERAEDVVDHMIEGEPNDEWELKWALMTQAEIDAMPEHEGW